MVRKTKLSRIIAFFIAFTMLMSFVPCITFGETVENNVVQVGDKNYSTLQEAVNNANENETIKLLQDTQENITIPSDKNIVLDLNGKVIDGGTDTKDENGKVVENNKATILNNGTVTIKDSSAEQTGTIKRSDENIGGYYVIDNQGTMTIESGKVYNNTANSNGSSLIRNGGNSSKTANKLIIAGGTIEQDNFIAIKNDDYGVLEITGGTIVSEKESAVQNWAKADITGGTVNGLILTSTWSNDLEESVTTISDKAVVNGRISVRKYSSNITKVPSTVITGGTLNITEWKTLYDSVISVSGGTFESIVPEKYIADGSGIIKDSNGKYSVEKIDETKVAYVGGTYYSTLQEAVNNANENETIKLLQDTQENITIPSDKNIVLDLNGKVIDGGTDTKDENGKVVENNKATILNNGTVTIKDSSAEQTGTIKRSDENIGGYYVIDNQGTMTIESGKVYNNTANSNGSSLIRNGGNSSKTANKLIIAGGTIEQDNFIAIKNDEFGVLEITGGTIASEKESAVQNWTEAKITGGTITGTIYTLSYTEGSKTSIGGSAIVTGNVYARAYLSNGIVPTVEITGGTHSIKTWKSINNGVISVSGGSFESAVPDEYCANGYAPKYNEDSTSDYKYGVSIKDGYYEVSDYIDSSNDNVPQTSDSNKIFAGWYTDDTYSTTYEENKGLAFAKFVSKDVLGIRYQIPVNTTSESESTALRIVSSVDSVNYDEVGFDISINGNTISKNTTTVYNSIIANVGDSQKLYDNASEVFDTDSKYFFALVVNDIPNSDFNTEITLKPYWIIQQGERKIYGPSQSFSINDIIDQTSNN